MMFLDCPTTSKEGDKENDATNHDQKNWRVEEGITQKVQIVAINALDHASGNNQSQASDL